MVDLNKKTFNLDLLGCLPKALLWNFIIGALVLLLGIALGGPKIYIELKTAILVFCLLLLPYIAITWWSIFALAKYRLRQNLVMEGPYQFVRNPMYSAIIFILNPALGILFRSWLLFLAAIPVYFVWKKCVKIEEQDLEQKFGQSYLVYQRNVWRFFPNLWRVNKVLFYAVAGILIFAVTFVGLNFSAFYLRWVTWDSQGEITYDQKPKKEFNFGQASSFSSYKAAYNPSSNSIIINKINVKAPIVSASGTTQKELNSALNQGAVLYPGSVLPGQSGEVFLTAHSSVYPWNKTIYGQVFSLLDKLETGDIVSVVYNNYQYDYQITGKVILNASEVKIREIYEPRLTLMTCWPIGTSLKRLVVYGELVR